MKLTIYSFLAFLLSIQLTFGQTTLHVPGTFATVQDAVNASTNPLDIVQVASGTYIGAINVSKSLTIKGPNAGTPGSGTRVAEAIIENSKITVAGSVTVTIDGLRIFQTNNASEAVLLGGASTVTVQNCVLVRNGITPNAIVRAITTSSGPGIKTIQHNLISGDVSGGLFAGHKTWNSGLQLIASESTIIVINNTIQNCRTGISFENYNSGITFSGNLLNNNGTHISVGGGLSTSGQFATGPNDFTTPGSALVNLASVSTSFKLDISSGSFNGLPFVSFDPSTLFQIEQSIFHKGRSGRNGLVIFFPNTQFVIPIHPFIQTAIDYASPGSTIYISPGSYVETISVTKVVTIKGSGSGSDAGSNTILTQSAGGAVDPNRGVVQLNTSGNSGNPVKIKDIRIQPVGLAGISVGRFNQSTNTQVNHVSLENVQVVGTGQLNSCNNPERGLYVDSTSSLNHLTVINSTFNNLVYGWYFHKKVGTGTSSVDSLQVTGTSFIGNMLKGVYAEKLSNTVFDGCSISNNGIAAWANACPDLQPFQAGIDLNLVSGSYANIRVLNSILSGNGKGEAREGAALNIKARNDAPDYNGFPASLNNVVVENCFINGNERGVRVGEPGKNNATPSNLAIRRNSITGNTKGYSGNDGTAYGNIVNATNSTVQANCNWFGSNDVTSVSSGINGSVSFLNFLLDGTDGNVSIGFQPTAICNDVPVLPLAAPVISLATGTYDGIQTISITSTNPDASIYYTTSGNLPVVGTGFTKLYTGPFQVLQTTTIRAMVVKSGQSNSPVSVSFITITNPGIVATPVISPGSGSYGPPQLVSITTTTEGAQIYYTTTGNTPVIGTGFTRLYTGPFLVPVTSTIKAMGVKTGILNSAISTAVITITNPVPVVATPVITPGTGTYSGAQTVNITCATPEATIYFTTTGNTPVIGTSFTRIYSAPFVLSTSRTIRAMATAPGFNNSAVAVSFVTIGPAREAFFDESENAEDLEVGDIKVTPNPSLSGRFSVQSPGKDGEKLSYSVLAVNGKVLASGAVSGTGPLDIDLSSQPFGLYILKIADSKSIRSIRLSKL